MYYHGETISCHIPWRTSGRHLVPYQLVVTVFCPSSWMVLMSCTSEENGIYIYIIFHYSLLVWLSWCISISKIGMWMFTNRWHFAFWVCQSLKYSWKSHHSVLVCPPATATAIKVQNKWQHSPKYSLKQFHTYHGCFAPDSTIMVEFSQYIKSFKWPYRKKVHWLKYIKNCGQFILLPIPLK